MRKLLAALVVLFMALPAMSVQTRRIPRLTSPSELRGPVTTDCTTLTNQNEGNICYDSNDDEFYLYDGSTWVQVLKNGITAYTVGDGTATDITVTFDVTGTDPILTWDDSESAFELDFDGTLGDGLDPAFKTGSLLFPTSLVGEGATADLFETTLTITDPTSDRTITFQDLTGTVVTASTAVDAICGNVSFNPGSVAANSMEEETQGSVTGIAFGDACACSLRTEFDDDLLMLSCRPSSADTLAIMFYNNTGSPIDAGAQTVDYCCFSK